ncbi:MAG TPA: von Willebrand factor type A domain-containing protein, partial [Vicinamibacterales bacterium]|nr:von Willebrand factor type A domain-containing protein [Vicinamibacterales bacterium]
MTRINPNDPRWTAYVLGELDKAESEAVERLLKSSEEARALVEDLKTASVALAEALDEAPADLLTSAQRASVRRAADAGVSSWFGRLPRRWIFGTASVAAAAIVVAVVVRAPQLTQPVPDNPAKTATSAATSQPSRSTIAARSPASPEAPRPSVIASNPAAGTSAPVQTTASAPNPGSTAVTVSGTVRDSSGTAIPGVTVTATNPANGSTSTVVTDATGRYTFTPADAAPEYRMTAALAGFQTASADLKLAPRAAVERDFTLSVGALTETITVSGERPVVDSQSSARQAPGASATLGNRPVSPGGAGGGRGGGRGVGATAGLDGGVAGGVAGGVVGDLPTFGRSRVPNTNESYARTDENTFVRASQEPLATFSIDVDTASFSNIRRFLNQNQMPPRDAVRIEELVNYFTYDYAGPSGGRPIGTSMAVTTAPWNSRNRLVRIGVKAREIDRGRRPPSNLVFLIDVSGSMSTPQKLPLVKSGLKLLVDQLGENDTVSIVVYASATGMVLPPTRGDRKDVISRALDDLQAGGSTNGGAGIQLAYSQATANFIRGGVNRVILMTDGDFNVGITSQGDLTRLIEDRAKSGVFLSVLGFGMGNLKDSTMEKLADIGNGHYAYIDTLNEARKVLVEEMSGTLITVAKDVKIQVDFNPAKVEAYRLIGYENRILRAEDFNNDLKDAGDMGAGHSVTALFEIVPRGGTVPGPSIDPSVFQAAPRSTPAARSNSNDLLVLRLRYKLPEAAESTRMDVPLADREVAFARADSDVRFAASVAAFGMILKNSPYKGDATLEWVLDTA